MNDNIPIANTKVISKTYKNDNSDTNDDSNVQTEVSDNLASIIFFILITTVFSIVTYLILPNKIPTSDKLDNSTIYYVIYILLLVIGNYFINLNISKSVCGGTPQWATTMINTLVPWGLIFAVINIILIVFPGWISPFANTFGYGIIKLMGLKGLLNKILNIRRDETQAPSINNQDFELVQRGIEEIYSNNSLFVNEIPVNVLDFKNFVQKLISTKYFKKSITIDSPEIITLFKFVQLKEIVGKYIWYLLSGILVTSISYNFIVNIQCNNSVLEMKKNRDNFIISERKKLEGKKDNRVYYPFVVGKDNDIDVKSSSYGTTQN